MKSLVDYLEESFAIPLEIRELAKDMQGSLPLYLKSSYHFFEGRLLNKHIIFVEPVEGSASTPDQRQKQAQILRDIFKSPVVFILESLEPWERKRLISRNVAFVQPGRQLYIPEILMDLSDVKSNNQNFPARQEQLSHRAQLALLYHLEVRSIENRQLQEVARDLNYSAMNISRIVKELEQHQLIKLEGSKEKQIVFNQRAPEKLWREVEPLMNSPIRETWFTDENPADEPGFSLSHDSALTRYSMLNEGNRNSYAIGRDRFRNLMAHKHMELEAQYGRIRIEVWYYNPMILSRTNVVDRLSLYLSMRNESDERIKTALEEMINDIKW